MVPSCLIPGPGMSKEEEYCLLGRVTRERRDLATQWLVCIANMCSCLSSMLSLLLVIASPREVVSFQLEIFF